MQLPLIEVGNAMRAYLLLNSFLSLDILVAFSILKFGTSAKSVSWVGLTQFNRTWRTRRCSGMRRTCPSQLHLLSRAFITTFIVGFRASPWMVLPLIYEIPHSRKLFSFSPLRKWVRTLSSKGHMTGNGVRLIDNPNAVRLCGLNLPCWHSSHNSSYHNFSFERSALESFHVPSPVLERDSRVFYFFFFFFFVHSRARYYV